ncbi:NAD(P)/FAD-dependent oxidoreductase [Neoroseomonas oryzicola]|uniref:FAD-binding oxidoreductase n=1 Tax=Neoroseomonas oryzicola TaxID=535904 RepID=A0A9X9WHL0_9PROT|nr:FAD-binding oxidoreductase [Neoroseomonas oryzicola]MBR0659820.1 FAD-binding oxidoreductase [Neoroseomonas oryzicola]NKE19528.1 FAD-binding oxidoreductase [Neoroseomonas oryzicola]
MDSSVFHPDFKAKPFWWEAIAMGEDDPPAELPPKADVVIVGGGLTGLNCAIELGRGGTRAVVLDAEPLGFGASTRNGGGVSGGNNVGKGLSGAKGRQSPEEMRDWLRAIMGDASEGLAHIEALVQRENIQCFYERTGRFVGAWTPKHYDGMAAKIDTLNEFANADASMLPRARQREEMASDYYYGGMLVNRTGKIHPGLYHRGLMQAAQRCGATLLGRTKAGALTRTATGWRVETSRGPIEAGEVVIATNGYTGSLTPDLRRRLIPVASHIIATEELDPELARSLIPNQRTLADSRRILTYYRMSHDNKRVIFGGRARFTQVTPEVSAPILHAMMLARWPQLKGVRVTHAWTGNVAFAFDYLPHMGVTQKGLHYAMACNGAGVAMLSYLGAEVGKKLLGKSNKLPVFDGRDFPTRAFYTGNPWMLPMVGSWYRFRDWLDRKAA